jgi:putative endonuclease
MARTYFVYILASESRELYVGVTNNLHFRIGQHRTSDGSSAYSVRHKTTRLVYCETSTYILDAIRREKQIKGWTRRKKLELIESRNPDWKDLAAGWRT